MASSHESSPRHVGRVVDPLARDDGAIEPEIQLAESETGALPALRGAPTRVLDEPARDVPPPHDDGSADDAGPRRGQSMRERLLERAQAYRDRRGGADGHPISLAPEAGPDEELDLVGARQPAPTARATSSDELDLVGAQHAAPTERAAATVELDLVGARHRAHTARAASTDSRLSPTLQAVFGTLLGLTTVATLTAVAMKLDSEHPMGSLQATPSAGTERSAAVQPTRSPAAWPPVKRHWNKLPGPWRIADAKKDPTLRVIRGTIGDKPFLRVVQDAGLAKKQAYRVLVAMKGLLDLDHPSRSDEFAALVERNGGKLKAFEYIQRPEDVFQAKEGADGLLHGAKLDLKMRRDRFDGAIVVGESGFEAAARYGGFQKGIEAAVSKALDGRLDLDDLKPGTALRVISQEVTVLGEFARYAGAEAVEVRFVDPETHPLRVYYLPDARVRGYYDAAGKAPYEGGWRKPIDAPITSRFDPKRMHPILHRIMPHNGTDFGAPIGTPVGASAPGVVEFIGNAGAGGNLVKLKHADGIETGYAHLSRFAEGLTVGDRVRRLQVIGYVGSTGRSTGPHLHFSAKRNGKFFDPETLNLDGMRVLTASERAEFDQLKAKYDAELDAIALPPRPPPIPDAALASAAAGAPAHSAHTAAAEPPARSTHAERKAATAPEASTSPSPASAIYLTDEELRQLQSEHDGDEAP